VQAADGHPVTVEQDKQSILPSPPEFPFKLLISAEGSRGATFELCPHDKANNCMLEIRWNKKKKRYTLSPLNSPQGHKLENNIEQHHIKMVGATV